MAINVRLLRPLARQAATLPGTPASLLLRFDGNFDDSSANALTMTAGGSVSTSTAQSKFGGASGLFGGTNGRVSGASSSLFAFGAGDFTVEMWVRMVSESAGFQTIFTTRSSNADDNANAFWLGVPPNLLTPLVYSDEAILETGGLSVDVWSHVAVTRANDALRMFVDGVLVGNTLNYTNFTIGNPTLGYTLANEHPLNAYIDDVRIVKGLAVYTSDFTPPTGPLTVNATAVR